MALTSRLNSRSASHRILLALFSAALLLALDGATARAQSDYASIPLALAPGAPAGSYRLSDIDTVNLFNGHVNVNLPLAGINGRGDAKSAMSMVWDSPAGWRVGKYTDVNGNPAYYVEPDYVMQGSIQWGDWSAYFTRSTDGAVNACYPGTLPVVQFTLARLHVVEPDGTEHELRDAATGGQKLGNDGGCYSEGPSRGKVFVSTDGSGITVVFTQDVHDGIHADGDYVTGGGASTILLPDGRRILSDGLRDRNGNMLHGGTDSLGRTVSQGMDTTGNDCVARGGSASEYCRYISYGGFGGAERRIYVTGTNEHATAVFLPNNLSYKFYYNQYGDLTRIDLPTGGCIEYDYEPGLAGTQPAGMMPGNYSGGPNDSHIYRRVTERRLYKEGHALVNRQTFSKPEDTQGGNAGFVEKKTYDSNGTTLLGSEKHYFYGSANATFSISDPSAYPAWKSGKEYHTEVYDAAGNLLRVIEQSWQQRAPVSWWTGAADDEPSNDPRVYQTVTTLENGLTHRTLLGFDPTVPYNSQSDVYEYDYVAGGAETLLRHAHTDYEKSAAYVDPPPTGAYLRNLPKTQWVSTDGWGNNRVSRTDYGYDEFALLPRSNITGYDPSYATGVTARGNVTSVTRYADAMGPSGAVTTTSHYDIAGNVVSATDAKGNTTNISYDDSFCNDSGVRCGGTFTPYTYAFPTIKTSPVPDSSAELNAELGTSYAGALSAPRPRSPPRPSTTSTPASSTRPRTPTTRRRGWSITTRSTVPRRRCAPARPVAGPTSLTRPTGARCASSPTSTTRASSTPISTSTAWAAPSARSSTRTPTRRSPGSPRTPSTTPWAGSGARLSLIAGRSAPLRCSQRAGGLRPATTRWAGRGALRLCQTAPPSTRTTAATACWSKTRRAGSASAARMRSGG
jgi:YD repeat-containing protein